MNRTIFVLLFAFACFAATARAVALQSAPPSSFVDPQSAEKANAHEDELYNAGNDALHDDDFEGAAAKFDEVAKMRGRKADAALYWKAYSLNQAGDKAQALTTIAELKKSYPQSKYVKDAEALVVDIKGASVNPDDFGGDDAKMIALMGIMNSSDPDKAVPILDKIIHSNNSLKVKERALFVLSQSGSEKAQQLLIAIAKNNSEPELQKRAIRNLGMNSNPRNRAALKEIYGSATDPAIKKTVFQGWLMSGDKEDVLAVVKQEKSPELRREAIKYLGMMGGREELREIYKNASDADTKEAVLTGMMMCGDAEGLAQIAKTEKDPKVMGKVINTLGLVGGDGSIDTLLTIYTTNPDFETKKHVINALFLHGASKQMIAMARKETNPELKRAWIQKLSLMGGPDVTDYMMEILNK